VSHEAGPVSLHEPYAHLYVGDYFSDTLNLSAREHRALQLLLFHAWVDGIALGEDATLTRVTGLTICDWESIKPTVLPLAIANRASIADKV
jgi:uncharacterized protein YdaU (DUF1376 family)